jgi:hypothetical protein
MPEPVTIGVAARRLGKSPATLRRWLQDGAPAARPGRPGRNCGALVHVDDLARWKSGVAAVSSAATLDLVARALRAVLQRNAIGFESPAPFLTGVRDDQAAALLVEVWKRVALDLLKEIPSPGPDIKALGEIAKSRNRAQMRRFDLMAASNLNRGTKNGCITGCCATACCGTCR